jgi:hypothetical protein
MKQIALTFSTLILIVLLAFFSDMTHGTSTVKSSPNHLLSQDTTFDSEAALATLREQIKGRENEPADKVFDNRQIFKDVPAARLLMIMKMGFNRSLGVACDHCHNPEDWGSGEKPQKQIVRDMKKMADTINGELLPKIENLQSSPAIINCTTCHRGATSNRQRA